MSEPDIAYQAGFATAARRAVELMELHLVRARRAGMDAETTFCVIAEDLLEVATAGSLLDRSGVDCPTTQYPSRVMLKILLEAAAP